MGCCAPAPAGRTGRLTPRLTESDQRFHQVGRPDKARRGAHQSLARRIAAVGQADHVMAEMGEDAGKIEAGEPLPGILVLSRPAPFWCSERKNPAAVFRQSRRTDHPFTHAFLTTTRTSVASSRKDARKPAA